VCISSAYRCQSLRSSVYIINQTTGQWSKWDTDMVCTTPVQRGLVEVPAGAWKHWRTAGLFLCGVAGALVRGQCGEAWWVRMVVPVWTSVVGQRAVGQGEPMRRGHGGTSRYPAWAVGKINTLERGRGGGRGSTRHCMRQVLVCSVTAGTAGCWVVRRQWCRQCCAPCICSPARGPKRQA
jgi:hypothetical protein